jgi:hypothetical protein
MRPLVRANVGLLVLLVAHASEHVVRVPGGPGAIPGQVWVAVALLFALLVGSLVLSARGDDRAPRFAIGAGAACVIAPLAGHFVPVRTALSQPFWDQHVDLLSWSLVLGVAVGGIWLARSGVRAHTSSAAPHGRLLTANVRRPRRIGGTSLRAAESQNTDPWKRMSDADVG